ncbi:MAG TPA: ABC transporter ATP-binding protein [Candidatus Aphodomonas merdavium]|nr:ABC transporter ATP-binding protein [Candidatus Aphodomonas merdavium]
MIEVRHLTKRYGAHVAVEDLNFRVEPGRIYGLLGPNGAGKTTTMNMITGCLAASQGDVLIDGHDIFEEPVEAKRLIGYLPEIPPVYTDMTVEEYLSFVAEAKGIARKERARQLEDAVERTALGEVRHRLIGNLSKGFRQRVGIAQALLGNPEIVILDEPTVGLDPAQIIEIRDLIRTLGERHTVILSSHILSEISAVCDSVMIIAHGKLVASGTPQELTRLFQGKQTLHLTVRGAEDAVRGALRGVAGVLEAAYRQEEGQTVAELTCAPDADLREPVFFACAAQKLPILEMRTETASLEDIFLELTQEGTPVAAAPEADTAAGEGGKAQ